MSIEYFENILKQFSKIYEELKDVKIKFQSHDLFKGYCNSIPIGEYEHIGKMRYKQKKTISITINPDLPDKLFVFLHEMTHAITPYYERKVKNEWIRLDHSDKFYTNFHKVMEIAFKLNIVDNVYDMKELKRRDESSENIKSDLMRFKNI